MDHVKVSGYLRFRLVFTGIISLVWFLLLWGLGYLVASKLPGDGPVLPGVAGLFFLTGFFPILLFGAPGMLIGFQQQYLEGAFALSKQDLAAVRPPLLWHARTHNSPWLLGLNRLMVFWGPAVLLATLLVWLVYPNGISRSMLALSLGILGVTLAGLVAMTSTGRPFLHDMRMTGERRLWRGSFSSYLFWRHGLPWGIGNAVLNAVLAIPLFPAAPDSEPGLASVPMVSVDIFFTALILCFFMAISAHPQALVDGKTGLIGAPMSARSPRWGGRTGRFVSGSAGFALLTAIFLWMAGIDGFSVPQFVLWKGLMAGVIAAVAAMATAYWTLARLGPAGLMNKSVA